MVIILDFDDVCVDFHGPFCEYFNLIYNTHITRETLTDFRFYEELNISKKEFQQCILDFYATEEFENLNAVPGSKEGIAALKEIDELIVISYRDKSIEELTKKQAEKLFPGMIKDIICIGEYKKGIDVERKEHIAKKLKAIFAVDDGIHHIEAYATQKIPAFLFTQPWNKHHACSDGHIRVDSWKELVAIARRDFLKQK